MTWLHRHTEFSPDWGDIETADLGRRQLLFHTRSLGYKGLRQTIVVADSDKTICRRLEDHSYLVPQSVGTILFEPGTAIPIAYTGAGACMTESPGAAKSQVDSNCDHATDATIEIHGFAWPSEGQSDEAIIELSRKRIAVLERRLEDVALPERVSETFAYGSTRTRAPIKHDEPVLGLLFAIDESIAPPRYQQSIGPPMSEKEIATVHSFMEKHAPSPAIRMGVSTAQVWRSLEYVSPGMKRVSYSDRSISNARPALRAMEKWAEEMVKVGCNMAAVAPLANFL